MLFELFLGMRYLKAKRKQAFISIITIISIAGITVGVMSLIVVLSVMNGFRADLMSKILGVKSHLSVLHPDGSFRDYQDILDKVRSVEGVAAATPYINSQVLVNSMGNSTGALLWGIDARTAGQVMALKDIIKERVLDSLDKKQGELPAIIIGKELANRIGAGPGDVLTVISPQGKLTPLGRIPQNRLYLITGLFNSGYYEYDASMVFVSLAEAQELLGMEGRVSGLQVKTVDVDATQQIGERIDKKLSFPFLTRDWKAENRNLVAALKLEKITMFVILTMIVLVAGLNIISTLVMVVMEKHREIAILRAMGARKGSILGIFILQGSLVGLVGTLLGLFLGLGLCYSLAEYKFIKLDPTVYYITSLPVKVDGPDVVLISLAALGIALLATLYPAWRAAQVNPVEALRYE